MTIKKSRVHYFDSEDAISSMVVHTLANPPCKLLSPVQTVRCFGFFTYIALWYLTSVELNKIISYL